MDVPLLWRPICWSKSCWASPQGHHTEYDRVWWATSWAVTICRWKKWDWIQIACPDPSATDLVLKNGKRTRQPASVLPWWLPGQVEHTLPSTLWSISNHKDVSVSLRALWKGSSQVHCNYLHGGGSVGSQCGLTAILIHKQPHNMNLNCGLHLPSVWKPLLNTPPWSPPPPFPVFFCSLSFIFYPVFIPIFLHSHFSLHSTPPVTYQLNI